MSIIQDHIHQAKKALQQLLVRPLGSVLTLVMLMVLLSFPLVLYLTTQSLQDWRERMVSVPQLNIFLDGVAELPDVAAIQASIKNHPKVRRFEYISKDRAWEDLKNRKVIDDHNTFSGLINPLPDTFVVMPNVLNPGELNLLKEDFEALTMVEQVDVDLQWANRLYHMISFAKKILWVLGIAFGAAVFLVISNTVRMQILARRDEIEISKLMGAPDRFIRRPFVYYAFWQGLFASVAALLLSAWVVQEANPVIKQFAKAYDEYMRLRLFSHDEILTITFFVVMFSIVAAVVAATRHLHRVEVSS